MPRRSERLVRRVVIEGMTLFALVVRNQRTVYGGPRYGTEYTMDRACAKCGTGAQQTGPLRLRRFALPAAEMFLTLDAEVLVRPALAGKLRTEGVACLDVVLDAQSGSPLDVFQLRTEATLPPFAAGTTGVARERPCTACGRDGHYGIPHEPYRFVYDTLDGALSSKDALATYERFGTSVLREPFSDSVFAAPVTIVGRRIAAVLKAANLRSVELQPVRVAGEDSDHDGHRSHRR
jgi:hypothetical protein